MTTERATPSRPGMRRRGSAAASPRSTFSTGLPPKPSPVDGAAAATTTAAMVPTTLALPRTSWAWRGSGSGRGARGWRPRWAAWSRWLSSTRASSHASSWRPTSSAPRSSGPRAPPSRPRPPEAAGEAGADSAEVVSVVLEAGAGAWDRRCRPYAGRESLESASGTTMTTPTTAAPAELAGAGAAAAVMGCTTSRASPRW